MEKEVRNNRVAVLISHGFGAGWYSWHTEHKELLFHPKLVEMVEKKRVNEIDEGWVKDNLGIENVFCGGARSLVVHWLPVGTAFEVDEYDGSERLRTLEDLILLA